MKATLFGLSVATAAGKTYLKEKFGASLFILFIVFLWGGESRTLTATCWGEGEGSCARGAAAARGRAAAARARIAAVHAIYRLLEARGVAVSPSGAPLGSPALSAAALTHRLPLLSSLAPQTPAGRSGGTLPPRGSPRRSAARGRTSTATAASRRARCVRGRAGRASSCVSLSARGLRAARCDALPLRDRHFSPRRMRASTRAWCRCRSPSSACVAAQSAAARRYVSSAPRFHAPRFHAPRSPRARSPPRSNKGKDLIIAYTVKHTQDLDCGGSYVKLLPKVRPRRHALLRGVLWRAPPRAATRAEPLFAPAPHGRASTARRLAASRRTRSCSGRTSAATRRARRT